MLKKTSCDFLFSFSKNNFKRKDSKTSQTSLLNLEANENNLKIILKSSSIKLTWVNNFVTFSLNFKHNNGAYCYALETNK
jgi:hypothetical protein